MGKGIIICLVITFFVLGGVAILIAWSVDKIKSPTFSIDQGTIAGYNLTTDNRLNATFTLDIRSYNRDPKYNIEYRRVEVAVFHDIQTIAYIILGPYTHQHGVDLLFTAQPVAQNVTILDPDNATEVRNEAKAGKLKLEVRIRANVRFEVKGWKHKRYALGIICSPVLINLASGKTFEGTTCEVNRF